MLAEYETDHQTSMDVMNIASEIYQYTSGYPVLVSSICKCIDEDLPEESGFEELYKAWTKEGVAKAVNIILRDSSPLFESMTKQLDLYKDLRKMIEDIIYRGRQITYSPEQRSISLGVMFGFLKEVNDHVAIANRMFEMCLLNLFMAEESESDVYAQGGSDRIGFIRNNMLDMDLVLGKFVDYFTEICSQKYDRFIEKYDRKFFLIYLKPIINGTGNYYIEAQTRDERRTNSSYRLPLSSCGVFHFPQQSGQKVSWRKQGQYSVRWTIRRGVTTARTAATGKGFISSTAWKIKWNCEGKGSRL